MNRYYVEIQKTLQDAEPIGIYIYAYSRTQLHDQIRDGWIVTCTLERGDTDAS